MDIQRDYIGYGNHLPKISWPYNAQLAINFVLNYEEGAESCLLDGDSHSEGYLTDWPGMLPLNNERNLSVESLFEYGSRAGIWRILRLFEEYKIPITIFATGLALERNPLLAKELKTSSHEVAGHGYRWINYALVDELTEREHIAKTLASIQLLTEKTPVGWYTGRRSRHTRKLIVEAGLRYDSDSYADDFPYWLQVSGKQHLVIPYNLDSNDARYAVAPGWSSGQDFLHYLQASFDCLYREGAQCPKIMTIGLHARLSGRPGRAEALRRFIDYIAKFKNVWICRREDLANYWHQNYPSKSVYG